MTDTFARNIGISAAGHVLILAFVFIRAVFIPSEPIEIRKAIRVDVVALPDKMPSEQLLPPAPAPSAAPPKAEPAPAPKAEPAKPPAPKPDAKAKPKPDLAKSQNDALAKLKKMSALDKIRQDVSSAKSEAAAKDAAAKAATVVKGNQVSAGNSLTGLEKIEYDKYFDDIEGRVRSQWNIPQWLADAGLKAQVQILIDERGYVTKKILRRSSGNDIFDGQVMAAIDASSPLPEPPSRLHGALSTGGIILNFPE